VHVVAEAAMEATVDAAGRAESAELGDGGPIVKPMPMEVVVAEAATGVEGVPEVLALTEER